MISQQQQELYGVYVVNIVIRFFILLHIIKKLSLSEEIAQWNMLSFQRDRFFEHAEECPKFKKNPQTYPRTVYLD